MNRSAANDGPKRKVVAQTLAKQRCQFLALGSTRGIGASCAINARYDFVAFLLLLTS
jgi:hypothetical protein